VTLTSHILFNFFDAAGFVCREGSDPRELIKLRPGDKAVELTFSTSQLCQSTGVLVERNGLYLIQLASTASFHDGLTGVDASRGFTSSDLPNWGDRTLMTLATPLRREWFRPWFRVVARFGGSGGEETFLDPDPIGSYGLAERTRATRDGELFLFVNYPVIGIPGLFGAFYKNNA